MTQRIIPNIWCDRTAEEAGAFYETVFDGARSRVVARYPTEGLPDFQKGFEGLPVVVDVTLDDDFRISLINAGAEYRPTPGISLLVNVDPGRFGGDEQAARAWINHAWTLLAEHDRVIMDIGEYSFSPLYGWVEDQYGVSWQFKLLRPDADPIARYMPMLTFGADSRDEAPQALALYTSTFPDAEVGRILDYVVSGTGEEIVYTEFRLAGQQLSMMASPEDVEASFTPGVSLLVRCDGQEEIDRLWEALSAVPDAEACGWLVDRFGVSWQIVPADLDALLARPGVYGRMLRMTRIVIADL
ncbi:VOC family protein [uncultured Microbacterium sp.]|uniref:VOC family protein n=1 Tax=uncultured Microbacterium sp. TaxID=191216 RepID=UPI0025E548FC|nr:VOC family protein [uncultured Microbacterium sp.]